MALPAFFAKDQNALIEQSITLIEWLW